MKKREWWSIIALIVMFFGFMPGSWMLQVKSLDVIDRHVIMSRTVTMPATMDWTDEILDRDGEVICSDSGTSYYEANDGHPVSWGLPNKCILLPGRPYIYRATWRPPLGFLGLFPVVRSTAFEVTE